MDEDDFLFDDDDLNDVPDNTLQDLEQNALASTQRPKPASQHAPPTRRQLGVMPGLNRAGSTNRNIPWRPPQPHAYPPPPRPTAPAASVPDPPSSDYGMDNEEVIDLDEPSMVIHPASGIQSSKRQPPPAPSGQRHGSRATLDPETEAAFAAADAELGEPHIGHWSHAPHLRPPVGSNSNVTSLEARIAELEAEQARLRKSEQEAVAAALAKQGEIAIVRANQDKSMREYERKMAVIQKLHADETAKQRAELEAGRKEREKMETDNRFLQHDLAQESERMKRLRGPGIARGAGSGTEKETPRKAKRTNLGDGFEDNEVRMVSPSKSKDKAKDQSPRHGAKRKRSAQDSPGISLSFPQPSQLKRQDSNNVTEQSFQSSTETRATVQQDHRYETMQRLLNHRSGHDRTRTIELLGQYSYPSDTRCTLSSILMDRIAMGKMSLEDETLPLIISYALLDLWLCCLRESFFEPLYLILDLLQFTFSYERASVVSQVMEMALPICIRSIDSVAYPLTRASLSPEFAASLDREAHNKLIKNIDVDEILGFLTRVCHAASLSTQRIESFWQLVEASFVLQMLNKALSISQISKFLQILAMSALSTTFGAISPDPQIQTQEETAILERLTGLLFEIPDVPKGEPAYSEEEIMDFRVEVLNVFKVLCGSDHGCLLLAQHRSAIGRLIRFLDEQVNKLYSTQPAIDMATEGHETELSAHTLVVRAVNTTIRIVYHIWRTHEQSINIIDKILFVRGGYQKFLISMTRVAFSEQLVFEHGIEDDVSEAAHTILDSVLSPEEGEAVVKAVETPMGTRGTNPMAFTQGGATEKDTSLETTQVDVDATMSDVS